MMLRCSGVVRAVGERAWSSQDGKRSGMIRFAVVESAPLVDVEITLGDSDRFGEGEVVDLAVEVTASRGFLRVRPKGRWPEVPAAKPQPVRATA